MRNPDSLDDRRLVRIRPPHEPEPRVTAERWQRISRLGPVGLSEGVLQAARVYPDRNVLEAFVWSIRNDCQLRLVYAFDEDHRLSLSAGFVATDSKQPLAADAALDLERGFAATLAAAGLTCELDTDCAPPHGEPRWRMEVLPAGFVLATSGNGESVRAGYTAPCRSIDEADLLIAQPRTARLESLGALLRGLAAVEGPTRLEIAFLPRLLKPEELRLVRCIRQQSAFLSSFPRIDGLPPISADELDGSLEAVLRRFEREGRAVEMSVELGAAAPLPDSVVKFAASVLWGSYQPSSRQIATKRDLRRLMPIGYTLPQWLPMAATFDALSTKARTETPAAHGTCNDLLLGTTAAGTVLRLAEAARARHLYCSGATGTGKSTALANWILQDIKAGRGLIFIDPHGDVFADILARVPIEAVDHVLAFDLADPDYAPGLNIFDIRGDEREMAISLVCGELLRIIKDELFSDIPEAFGPVFQQYFQAALKLLLLAPFRATIVDILRVFQDSMWREALIDACPDPLVQDFWRETAGRITRDELSLTNIAPYITSKAMAFVDPYPIRTIVGQRNTTLRFDEFMDSGRAVLISLSKGILGTQVSRILGLLLLQQIQIACLARARRKPEERRPVTLFVDEAHAYIGGALTELLAEARKFGLSLVFASQTLSQLHGSTASRLVNVLLGNVGNLLALRLGIADAEILSPWLRPHTISDLVRLPDFTAIGRVLDGNRPCDPTTILLPPLPTAGDPTIAGAIVAQTRSSHCRPRKEVEQKLQKQK